METTKCVGERHGLLEDRGITEVALQPVRRCICEHATHDKIGFATATAGLKPINGLRHRQIVGTSGWYIWCGESFSEAADFFDPLHASHIQESQPDASRLFGLPPGYRFLLAGDYLDVWHDEKLLSV
ncbi:MAG: hypothetical protein ACLPH3_20940 [Terracidiphilus sp.]